MTYVPKYLKLQRESAWMGSLVGSVVFESNLFFVDIVDESMNPDQGFIDAETAGYLEPRLRLPGGYLVAGDIGMLVDVHSILPILHAFCGASEISTNSIAVSAVYSHVFKPGLHPKTLRATLNPNVEDVFGGGSYKGRALRGFAIKTIEIAASAREACTMTITNQSAKDMQVDRDAVVTFPTVRPLSFTDGVVSSLSGDVKVEAFTLRAERIMADDNFALGSRFLPFLHAAGVTVSGSMDIGFREWATFKKFWGGAAATEPALSPLSYTLQLKFEGDIAAGAKKQSLQIDCPKIFLNTTNANIDRRERIVQGVDFTGLYDPTSGYGIKFTVIAKKKIIWKPG
jgi:hypothetical protein